MTVKDRVVSAEPPWREREDARSRHWRLLIGGLGLFWVCVLLLLMP
jgi:hypothetical protein